MDLRTGSLQIVEVSRNTTRRIKFVAPEPGFFDGLTLAITATGVTVSKEIVGDDLVVTLEAGAQLSTHIYLATVTADGEDFIDIPLVVKTTGTTFPDIESTVTVRKPGDESTVNLTAIAVGGSGGGGAVDSVNGQTGVVVLDASDVGADPTNTAATLVSAEVTNRNTAINAHAIDTTAVHGIADTAALVLTGDARLSDSRPPNGAAGGVLGGTYPNPSFAADIATQAELNTEIADRVAADLLLVPLTQKGAASGVATLDSGGKIPSSQLPSLALSEYMGDVASQAAMLALTGQRGDWCVRTDLNPNRTFILKTDDPTQLVNWSDVTTAGAVTSVDSRTGAVSLTDLYDAAGAAAAAQAAAIQRGNHTGVQAISTVTGLQTALDGKQPLDADLTTIAGLTATTDNFMQAKGSAWSSRTVAQVKTDLGLTGTNSGDQTITLTGDVTGSGTGSFAATLKNTGPGATGPSGSATVVPVVTIDAQGRVTALSTATIAIPESAVTSLVSDLAAKAPLASPTFTGDPKAPTPATSDNDTSIATTAMVQAAIAAYIAANNVQVFRGVIDCSASPNYPAADAGDTYVVSVAGKIGGASGVVVQAGDTALCITDGSAAGNQATVGANWIVVQANIDGAVVGPASATDGHLAQFDGASGKLIKGGVSLDTDGTLAAASATRVASQSAVKTYADAKVADAIADAVTTVAPSQNAVFDALALKAALAGPTFSGNPTAPTQAAGNNSTRLATTAYADALVADAINDAVAGIAPSQNAVFDALALKQPLDTDLTAIAALTSAASKGLQSTGTGTWALYDLTTAGKALLDDADATAQRATLGLGTAAVVNTGTGSSDVPTITQADARYAGSKILSSQTAATPVSNTTTETTVASLVVPAANAATGSLFTATIPVGITNNSGGALNLTLRLKFGSTTVFDTSTVSYPNVAGWYRGLVVVRIYIEGSSSQWIDLDYELASGGAAVATLAGTAVPMAFGVTVATNTTYGGHAYRNTTESTATDKTLLLTAQWSGASTSAQIHRAFATMQVATP